MEEAGEQACFDTNVHGVAPELVKVLGRLKYRTSYGQNVLNHSIEVAHLAGIMAAELGANVKIAKRAGLLHDIGKAVDHEVDGSHADISQQLCKKYRESQSVCHAIQAHHQDVEPQTIEAVLVQAADAISRRPPGRAPRVARELRQAARVAGAASPRARRASRSASPCRPAARCASWSSPARSTTTRPRCWRTRSPGRSRTSSTTRARSA